MFMEEKSWGENTKELWGPIEEGDVPRWEDLLGFLDEPVRLDVLRKDQNIKFRELGNIDELKALISPSLISEVQQKLLGVGIDTEEKLFDVIVTREEAEKEGKSLVGVIVRVANYYPSEDGSPNYSFGGWSASLKRWFGELKLSTQAWKASLTSEEERLVRAVQVGLWMKIPRQISF